MNYECVSQDCFIITSKTRIYHSYDDILSRYFLTSIASFLLTYLGKLTSI